MGLGSHVRFFLYHINETHDKWKYTILIFIVVHLEVADDYQEDAFADEDPANGSALYNFLYPDKELLPEDKEMTIFDHLEELRERIFVSVLAVGAAILGCFVYSKDLIMILEAPVRTQGVRFLQLAPGEFFFTTIKVNIQPPMHLSLTYKSSLHLDMRFGTAYREDIS